MTPPLCQYDVKSVGDREFLPVDERRPPCRRPATHIVEDYDGHTGCGGDLYLCALHARAFVAFLTILGDPPERPRRLR